MKIAATLELLGSRRSPSLRPFLWSLVIRTRLGGWISETEGGVLLNLEGEDAEISAFLRSVPDKLARQFRIHTIRLIRRIPLPDNAAPQPFRLLNQHDYSGVISPDKAPCPDCKRKMLDPESRFYRYPFLSCGNCGPRYSAALMAGTGRDGTSFRAFPPCEKCSGEIAEPGNSELLCCPECGPSVFLINRNWDPVPSRDPAAAAAKAMTEGMIVAVKNCDGFVIVFDPSHPEALRTIRERKQQPWKPVSIYVNDVRTVHRLCFCSEQEAALLTSPAAPVVPLRIRKSAMKKLSGFCPDNPGTVGVELPPSGMIFLLMQSRPDGKGGFRPFEMLGFSGGPVPVDPSDAGGDDDLAQVSQIADLILLHDLKIWHSGGPSVQTIFPDSRLMTVRRGSGICPEPLILKKSLKRTVLALGADTAASVAIGYGARIFQSHQMGNPGSERNFEALSLAAEHLAMMFAKVPEMIVCDMDQSTFSAKTGAVLSRSFRIPLAAVQRHHANALACLAEHQIQRALAFVWDDGAGGTDGTVWGAELMEVSAEGFRRLASFAPVLMNLPSERTRHPSFLLTRYLDQAGIPLTEQLAEKLNIPFPLYREWRESGRGRRMVETHAALPLFNAVFSALGISSSATGYDTQTILRMERAIAEGCDPASVRRLAGKFPFRTKEKDILLIDWEPFFRDAENFTELRSERHGDAAAAFLSSAAGAALETALYAADVSKLRKIVLSGKAFLSPSLTFLVSEKLREAGFSVYRHERTSPDESSVCIGQIVSGGNA